MAAKTNECMPVYESILKTQYTSHMYQPLIYSDTSESELNPFQNPIRVPNRSSSKTIFPLQIIETGLIRSWFPRTRIFKIILTVNTLDFKVKY